ncbi:MAG: ATP-dependent zinc protease [Gammaproteobacteria bacterium]|nr:ATP-dependent zinc protease [Gammaproteobacteria bacterium]
MRDKLIVGWREWIALPEFAVPAIKVKVDTGARTSALHAINIEPFAKDGDDWVRFDLQPAQRQEEPRICCTAPVLDTREIRDSGGHQEKRYVVCTVIELGDYRKHIEVTLTCRRNMKFRMLLGRTALKPEIAVDPGKSYRLGRMKR